MQVAVAVELDDALGEHALAVDHEIVEADAGLVLDQGERRARRPARRLDPARQQILDLHRRQIGLDVEPALAVVVGRRGR